MGVPTFGYVGLPIFVCRYLPLAANSEFIKKNAKKFTIKKKRCDQAKKIRRHLAFFAVRRVYPALVV